MWHTSSLLVTLQDSLSLSQIGTFVSRRSYKGQSQVCANWNICKAQIIHLRECTGNDFSAIRECEKAFQATLSPYLQIQIRGKSSRLCDEMIVAGIKSTLSKLRFGQCSYLFHANLLSDGAFDEKSRRIFQFCCRKPANTTAPHFQALQNDGVSPLKCQRSLIPCRRKHPKTPAFAQHFPATAGTAPKQAEKGPHFPTLSAPPEASAGICP